MLLSRRAALTLIDCKRRRHTHEPFGCDLGGVGAGGEWGARGDWGEGGEEYGGEGTWEDTELPFVVLLAFSGLREALTATGYNRRVDECCSAAASLLAATGAAEEAAEEAAEAGRLDAGNEEAATSKGAGASSSGGGGGANGPSSGEGEASVLLSDVTREAFEAHGNSLPDNERKRAAHYFGETSRVVAGVAAWRRGDLVQLGALMTASGISSIDNYECGCGPMDSLRAIVAETPGVFGARFSGAGFRGCIVALAAPEHAATAAAAIRVKYASSHPELAQCADVVITRVGAGARFH